MRWNPCPVHPPYLYFPLPARKLNCQNTVSPFLPSLCSPVACLVSCSVSTITVLSVPCALIIIIPRNLHSVADNSSLLQVSLVSLLSMVSLLSLLPRVSGGCLGAGVGAGSCPAPPFRAASEDIDHAEGCPAWSECCTEYGFCHPRVSIYDRKTWCTVTCLGSVTACSMGASCPHLLNPFLKMCFDGSDVKVWEISLCQNLSFVTRSLQKCTTILFLSFKRFRIDLFWLIDLIKRSNYFAHL